MSSGTGKSLAMLPFFPRDYLAATRHMTVGERGVYSDLLFLSWENGPLPVEEDRLARMVGCSVDEFTLVWRTLKGKFVPADDGRLVNERLEQHRREALRRREKKQFGARTTNAKRWGSESLTESLSDTHSGSPPSPSPSPSPSPNPSPKKLSRARGTFPRELHASIVAVYHEVLPDLASVKVWTDRRAKMLDTRIRERLAEGKPADTVEYWRSLFEQVSASDFLCGRNGDWRADLPWILLPENFAKVIEGRYTTRGAHGR